MKNGRVYSVRIEHKIEDCWIGCYWRKKTYATHIWVCIIPMFPVHITII